MTTLTDRAVDQLSGYGLTPRDYIDAMGGGVGSPCGCPDDRCAGSHHDPGEDCGCLDYFAAEILAGRIARGSGT